MGHPFVAEFNNSSHVATFRSDQSPSHLEFFLVVNLYVKSTGIPNWSFLRGEGWPEFLFRYGILLEFWVVHKHNIGFHKLALLFEVLLNSLLHCFRWLVLINNLPRIVALVVKLQSVKYIIGLHLSHKGDSKECPIGAQLVIIQKWLGQEGLHCIGKNYNSVLVIRLSSKNRFFLGVYYQDIFHNTKWGEGLVQIFLRQSKVPKWVDVALIFLWEYFDLEGSVFFRNAVGFEREEKCVQFLVAQP